MINAIKKINYSLKDDWILFFLTFLFHEIFVILLSFNFLKLPFNIIDQYNYHTFSLQISDLINNGSYFLGAVYPHHWYPLFVGFLYSIFGKSIFLATSFNAFLAGLSSLLLFNIIIIFDNKVNRKIVFWVVFLVMNIYASLMLHSSLLLKESWILFLILCIFYFSLRIFNSEKFNWFYFFSILLLIISLRSLRFFIGFAVIVGFLTTWFFQSRIFIRSRIFYGISMIFIVSLTTFFMTGNSIGKNISFSQYIQPSFIHKMRTDYFSGGSTSIKSEVIKENEIIYDSQKKDSIYTYCLTGIFDSFLSVFLGPFPWQLSFKKYILVFSDMLIWYVIFIFSILGIFCSRLKNLLLYLISVSIIIIGLAMSVGNFGALLRYRIPVRIIFSIFVPTGISFLWSFLKNKKNENTLHNN